MPPQDRPDDQARVAELASVYAQYADPAYNARWALDNPGNAAIVTERSSVLEALVTPWAQRHGPTAVLDLGCGSMTDLPPILRPVPRTGVDLLFERLSTVAARGVGFPLVCADGARLPFPAATFDAVTLSTVLSSVPDPHVRARITGEVDRVLRPGGVVVWYDMRLPSPRNRSVSPLSRRAVQRAFAGYQATWRSVTLLPPLARRLGRHAEQWYRPLSAFPVLRSHLAGILIKPA